MKMIRFQMMKKTMFGWDFIKKIVSIFQEAIN
jgi:hypothetical protein